MNSEFQDGPHCVDAQLCRADFYARFADALEQAGGSNDPAAIERYQNMPLWEVVDIIAQNGLRIVFSREWHVEPRDLLR